MSRGHNNPNAEERPSPAIDWNAVEWFVYRTPSPIAGEVGYFYRVTGHKLSPGELRMKEELACTVSRCSLAAVRKYLKFNEVPPEGLQIVVDHFDGMRHYRREAEDAPFRARMAERRAAAQAEFEARRRKAEQRLAEDVARAA